MKSTDEMPTTIMLDSGAFSAWRGNTEIDIDDYIDFLHANEKFVVSYVNLDVIPGKGGLIDRSQEALESSASQSLQNLHILHSQGLRPLPVFHQGERFYWLEKLMNMGEPYIGISPYLRAHPREIMRWLDDVFTLITDSNGRPLVRTHGFGVTSTVLCIRYPWWSVDSTSWATGAGVGNLEVPQYTHGKPDYTKKPISFHITHRHDVVAGKKSYDQMSQMHRTAIKRFCEEECGVNLLEVRNSPGHRWRVRLNYYLKLEEQCNRFIFEPGNKKSSFLNKRETIKSKLKPWNMTLIFSTTGRSMQHSRMLNKFGIANRLLSYFEMRNLKKDTIKFYSQYGLLHEELNRKRKIRFNDESLHIKRRLQIAERGSKILDLPNHDPPHES